MSQVSWRSFKKLDLLPETWNSTISQSCTIDNAILYKVLLRTGRFLTHVDFSDFADNLDENAVHSVAMYCPNLQNIDVTDLTTSSSNIETLAQKCTKIISFSLGHCKKTKKSYDKALSKLFAQNKNLKYIKFFGSLINGRCIQSINVDNLEEIVLEGCNHIDPGHFFQVKSFLSISYTLHKL